MFIYVAYSGAKFCYTENFENVGRKLFALIRITCVLLAIWVRAGDGVRKEGRKCVCARVRQVTGQELDAEVAEASSFSGVLLILPHRNHLNSSGLCVRCLCKRKCVFGFSDL